MTIQPKKLILANPLSPGDILMSTSAVRDLHKAWPGRYLTDVRCPAMEVWYNNPYITPINDDDPDAKKITMGYDDIHISGWSGRPFSVAYTRYLEKKLSIKIPYTTLRPDIYLSQDEMLWPSPAVTLAGYEGPYWIINAGTKFDYTLKYYPFHQEVVDKLAGKVQFVQIGLKEHNHKALNGVIDLRGKTNIRELYRLSYHAEGAVCAVSFQMVIQAALSKPCVVVAGGREGVRWQLYADHRYLYTNGALPCCQYDGCWKSKIKDCLNVEDGVPKCMRLITPDMIVAAILMYYDGGRLTWQKPTPFVVNASAQ